MRRAVVLFAVAACDGALDQRLSRIDETRVLAIVADPAEVKPNHAVTYTPLVVGPDGPIADAPAWSLCTAGKPPSEDNAVAPACLGGGDSVMPLGTGATITATIPMDACATFGPDVPSAGSGDALRPRDPDPTGGYYQPIRADVDGLTAFALSRITCNLPSAPGDVAHDYLVRYVANAAPTLDPIAIPPLTADTDVALVASWPAAAAEDYLWYDPSTQALATRHEGMRVSWFATAGELAVDSSGVAEDDRATTSVTTTWHTPRASGPVYLWFVLRDTRGGIAVRSATVTIP